MEDLAHAQNISSLIGEERQLERTQYRATQFTFLFYASYPHARSTQLACLLRTQQFNGQSLSQTSQRTDFIVLIHRSKTDNDESVGKQ